MSFVKEFSRVLFATTTTGTGTYSAGSAQTGFRDFAGAGANSGDTVLYEVVDDLAAPVNWEIGEGVWTPGSPSTLSRVTIIASSNANAAVSWAAGTKYIFSTVDGARLQEAVNAGQKSTDIASATTTDLSNAAGYVHVTGTATITALGTATAGVVRTVEFTGAAVLTHNATSLILPGGASITTAAGDIAVFRSEGSGNWRCAAYQQASVGVLSRPATAYTPSVITSIGTLTSVTAVGRYIQIGKFVSVIINIGITTNGTGAGFIVVTLPMAVASNAGIAYCAYGRNSNGKMLQGDVNAGTNTLNVVQYDNTYPGFDGAVLKVCIEYEAA